MLFNPYSVEETPAFYYGYYVCCVLMATILLVGVPQFARDLRERRRCAEKEDADRE